MHHTAVHPRYLHGKRGRRDPAPTNNFPKTTTIILTTVRNFGSSSGIIVDGYNTIYFPFAKSRFSNNNNKEPTVRKMRWILRSIFSSKCKWFMCFSFCSYSRLSYALNYSSQVPWNHCEIEILPWNNTHCQISGTFRDEFQQTKRRGD